MIDTYVKMKDIYAILIDAYVILTDLYVILTDIQIIYNIITINLLITYNYNHLFESGFLSFLRILKVAFAMRSCCAGLKPESNLYHVACVASISSASEHIEGRHYRVAAATY